MRLASVGQLRGVERLGARVVVEQLLELGELVVGLGAHHRRHEVVDHDGVGAALGLHALAGVVDHERIEERDVVEAGVGRAGVADSPSALPGSHSSVPCLPRWTIASTPNCVEPAVGREVVVGGREVAGRGRSRPGSRRSRAAAGWRRRRCRARRPAITKSSPSTYHSPGGGPQVSIDRLAQLGRAASRTTRRSRRPAAAPCAALQLRVGEELLVVAAGGDQRVDQLVAVGEVVLDAVAGFAAAPRSSTIALAGVSRPTALPTRACLVGKEESTIAVRCSRAVERPQPRVADREAARAGRSARGRARSAAPRTARSSIGSLKETGTPMMRPSNSGIATCIAASSGVRPESDSAQRCARGRRAQRLDDRDAERLQRLRVPLVARVRAAARQHGRDQRVDLAVEQLQRGRVAAQRVRPHADGWPPASSIAPRQRVDERRVAGDASASGRRRGRRAGARRGSAALRRHRRVRRADVAQLARRLEAVARRGRTCRRGSAAARACCRRRRGAGTRTPARSAPAGASESSRELGVGLGLAAEQDQRDAVALADARAASPRPPATRGGRRAGGRRPPARRATNALDVVERRRVRRADLREVRRRARATACAAARISVSAVVRRRSTQRLLAGSRAALPGRRVR